MSTWYLLVEKDGKKAVALAMENRQILVDLKRALDLKNGGYKLEVVPGVKYDILGMEHYWPK